MTQHDITQLDEQLKRIAETGSVDIEWSDLQRALRIKLEQIIQTYREQSKEDEHPNNNVQDIQEPVEKEEHDKQSDVTIEHEHELALEPLPDRFQDSTPEHSPEKPSEQPQEQPSEQPVEQPLDDNQVQMTDQQERHIEEQLQTEDQDNRENPQQDNYSPNYMPLSPTPPPIARTRAPPYVDNFDFETSRDELFDLIESFNEPPFTIQRICELLCSPFKYYDKTSAFFRGLEKNLRVVSSSLDDNPKKSH